MLIIKSTNILLLFSDYSILGKYTMQRSDTGKYRKFHSRSTKFWSFNKIRGAYDG